MKSFTCWNQMLCIICGQLTARDSMRDSMLALEAHQPKCYHLGFGPTVTCTNLGKANRNRNCKIFEEFADLLIETARKSYYKTDFEIVIEGNVYAFDSSTIDLCSSAFGGLNPENIKEALNCILYMMWRLLFQALY